MPKTQPICRRQGLTENSEQSKQLLVKWYQNKYAQGGEVPFLSCGTLIVRGATPTWGKKNSCQEGSPASPASLPQSWKQQRYY